MFLKTSSQIVSSQFAHVTQLYDLREIAISFTDHDHSRKAIQYVRVLSDRERNRAPQHAGSTCGFRLATVDDPVIK